MTLRGSRYLNVRFSAESRCQTLNVEHYCSVRIVAVKSNGAMSEFNPASGVDFAFDSGGYGDYQSSWGSHSMERTSNLLTAGTYQVKAQARVIYQGHMRLDDYTLAVEQMRP